MMLSLPIAILRSSPLPSLVAALLLKRHIRTARSVLSFPRGGRGLRRDGAKVWTVAGR